jgi:transcription elongation factor GreA
MSTVQTTAGAHEVHVGSIVSFTDTNAGREATFTLVSPEQANPSEGRLSMASPIARALLGHRVGDRVEAHTPKGVRPLLIAAIS